MQRSECNTISLSVISKQFQTLLLSRLKQIITMKKLIPNLIKLHLTLEQVPRIVVTIEQVLEEKK